MTDTEDIWLAVQEAIRKALNEAANAEIERLKHKFECEMGKVKNETVGKLLNGVEIATRYDLPTDNYVIQINIKK